MARLLMIIKKCWHVIALMAPGLPGGRFQAFRYLVTCFNDGIIEKLDGLSSELGKTRQQTFCKVGGVRGFIIYAFDYNRRSGGNYSLYRLCHDLNMRGIPAYVFGTNFTAVDLCAPVVSVWRARRLSRHGFVVVYPEVIHGNPLHAKQVVRWVMNRPGVLGGDRVYDGHEHVITYSDMFTNSIRNHVEGKLYLPTIDETIFFDDGRPVSQRTLECYYTGKAGYKPGFVNSENLFKITRTYPARAELGKLFRASRTLYSFDNTTILVHEALMCGCRVVLIPDGTQTRETLARNELGMTGVYWFGDVLPSDEEPHELAKRVHMYYEQVKRDYQKQLDRLVKSMLGESQNPS